MRLLLVCVALLAETFVPMGPLLERAHDRLRLLYDPPVPAYLALRPRPGARHRLERRLAAASDPASPGYGRWLSAEQVGRLAHPPLADRRRVLAWLRRQPQAEAAADHGDAIKFWAPRSALRTMFPPADSHSYTVPAALRGLVEFIEMRRRPVPRRPKRNVTGDNSTDDRYVGREALVRLYNISSTPASASVAAVEYQSSSGFSNQDVRRLQIWNEQDIHSVNHVVGANSGVDVESELDVQMLEQAGDGVDVWYWNSPYWLYAFAVDFAHAATVPDVISMSWGWAEDRQCDIADCGNLTSAQYVERVNFEYLKLALRGITIVVASGDAGAPGRTSEGCDAARPLNAAFPASSPYVLSVGATYVPLDHSNASYTSPLCQRYGCITSVDEKSVRFDRVGWTAGGGFDRYQNHTPWWQRSAVEAYLGSGVPLPPQFHRSGRAYPDVSALGHSCPTVVGNNIGGVDGTSCSAPLVAGLLATLNAEAQAQGRPRLGFVNPLLYWLQQRCAGCFRDVTDGYNWCTEQQCCDPAFGFSAAPGWDPVSGLGTLNHGLLRDHLLA
jgi:tripeptidyl-peptidase I